MLPWTHMKECFNSCIAQPVGICIFSFDRYWWISFHRSRVIFIIIRCICDEISLDSISLYGIQTASHSSLPGILSFQWGPSQARPGKMLHHDGSRVPCISGWEAWAADSVQGTSDSPWGEVRMSRWELYTPIQSHLSNYNTLDLIILNTLAVQIQESRYSILSLFLVNLISCSILSLMELSCPLTVELQPHCSTCACRDVYFDQVYSKTHKVKEA